MASKLERLEEVEKSMRSLNLVNSNLSFVAYETATDRSPCTSNELVIHAKDAKIETAENTRIFDVSIRVKLDKLRQVVKQSDSIEELMSSSLMHYGQLPKKHHELEISEFQKLEINDLVENDDPNDELKLQIKVARMVDGLNIDEKEIERCKAMRDQLKHIYKRQLEIANSLKVYKQYVLQKYRRVKERMKNTDRLRIYGQMRYELTDENMNSQIRARKLFEKMRLDRLSKLRTSKSEKPFVSKELCLCTVKKDSFLGKPPNKFWYNNNNNISDMQINNIDDESPEKRKIRLLKYVVSQMPFNKPVIRPSNLFAKTDKKPLIHPARFEIKSKQRKSIDQNDLDKLSERWQKVMKIRENKKAQTKDKPNDKGTFVQSAD